MVTMGIVGFRVPYLSCPSSRRLASSPAALTPLDAHSGRNGGSGAGV